MPPRQAIEPLDSGMQQRGIGRKADDLSSIPLWGWPAMITSSGLGDVGYGIHVVELASGNDRRKQGQFCGT